MHQPLESIRATVSLHLPCSLFIYLPRVANGIADDLEVEGHVFAEETVIDARPLGVSVGWLQGCSKL